MLPLIAEADWVQSLMNTDNFPLVAVFGTGLIIALVGTVSGVWLAARKATLDAKLKHELLDRGMSAEEIVMIVNSGRETTTADEMVKIIKAKKEAKS